MSSSVDAAEAVTDLINAAVVGGTTFAQTFTAVRAYVPVFALEDREPEGLTVIVTPVAHGNNKLTRATSRQLPSVAVIVIAKIPGDPINEAIDPLVALVEQIKDLVAGSLQAGSYRALGGLEVEPLFDADKLVSQRLFWARFTVAVQVFQ